MRRVGLTGNIASGKSTVAAVWRRLGAPVIDADELARRAVEPGSPALEEIRRAFGPDVLDEQGRLDRERMRAVVFGDPEARRRLEAIVHPRVAELRAEEERRLADEGARVVVHEIPLLFEVGLEDEFDVIAFVDAPAAVRLERIVRDRGLDPAEARRMIDAQMPAAEKRARSDMVIRNDADLERLERRAEATWRAIATDAGRGDRIRIDMHIHTRASFDCLSEPERVLEAAVERGIDRICITDHNEIDAALELRSRHPDRVIAGEEVKTAEGVDVIGLYIDERIPKGTPAEEACDRIRDQGGLVYVPHPFAGGKGGGGRLLARIADRIDAIEGFNARIHRQRLNDRAVEWARRRGLPLGAGSDAHLVGSVGRAYVEVPPFDDSPGGLLTALRGGRIHGESSSVFVHLGSTWAKLHKRLVAR